MADVNERATELAKENVKRYRLDNEVVVSDIYSNVHATFDSIVVNPPIRAGKAFIDAMFDGAADRLNPDGTLYVVMRKSHGANSAMAHLTEIFGNCEMIGREKGYFVFKSTKNGWTFLSHFDIVFNCNIMLLRWSIVRILTIFHKKEGWRACQKKRIEAYKKVKKRSAATIPRLAETCHYLTL